MKWKKQVASLCLMLAMTVGMSAVSYAQFPFHLMIGSAAPVTLSEQQGYQLALEQAVVKHTSRTTSLLSLPQNEALEQRGRELRHTIEHLQAICEAEEIARSKSRVHDLLGQRISLLLRALRDDQQPDEALLMDFARSLPTALREDSTPSPARRLALLRETFRGMDVSVEVRGVLPEDGEVAEHFAEIAVECVTNAVRHGFATCVQFHLFHNDCWRMSVTDNGIPPAGPIREGGGISEMRRRLARLGGTMELHTTPRFRIELSVPKEAERK